VAITREQSLTVALVQSPPRVAVDHLAPPGRL
jgi:hypothetical protein